jgi:HlyD family secretion protein
MKKRLIWIAVVVLLGGVAYVGTRPSEAETRPAVQRAAVSRGALKQTVRAIGTLQPLRIVRVGSQVSGTITALHADFNSVVEKDQVIAEMDPSLLEVQVAVQEANIARQENDIAHQRVQLANDEDNLRRAQAQFDLGLATGKQLEDAVLRVKNRAAQITSAETLKVQAEAQLEQAKLNVSYCTIRSPIDGVVVARMVDVGQTVQARGNVPQFFIIATELTTLRMSAGVDEADIGRIRPRMPVSFTVDGYRGETFTGSVLAVRLNAQINNNVVTYPVWIEVPNADLRLRPSMTANVDIEVDAAEEATLVPNDAIQFRPTADMFAWLKLPAPGPGRAARVSAPELVPVASNAGPGAPAERIDDLFTPTPKRINLGQVWVYDEAEPDPSRRLRSIPIRTGISDERFTEVVSGDLTQGLQLVTAITPPPALQRRAFGIFGQPQRAFGGMSKAEPEGPTRLQRGGGRRGGGGGRGRN